MGQRTEPPVHPARRLGYDTRCLTCEELIAHDERAFHERGVGAWHEDCPPPLNLPLYRKERDKRHPLHVDD